MVTHFTVDVHYSKICVFHRNREMNGCSVPRGQVIKDKQQIERSSRVDEDELIFLRAIEQKKTRHLKSDLMYSTVLVVSKKHVLLVNYCSIVRVIVCLIRIQI